MPPLNQSQQTAAEPEHSTDLVEIDRRADDSDAIFDTETTIAEDEFADPDSEVAQAISLDEIPVLT